MNTERPNVTLIRAMKTLGIPAQFVMNGISMLDIRPFTSEGFCQICASTLKADHLVEPKPATWQYHPQIAPLVTIHVCDFHLARAIKGVK